MSKSERRVAAVSATERLGARTELLLLGLEGLSSGMLVVDEAGYVLVATEAAARLLGPAAERGNGLVLAHPATLEGGPIAHAFTGVAEDELSSFHAEVFAKGEATRSWPLGTTREPGARIRERARLVHDDDGRRLRVSLLERVSDETKGETALLRCMQNVLGGAPVLVVELDAAGAVTLAEGRSLAGLGPGNGDPLIGQPMTAIVKDPALAAALARTLEGGDVRTSFEAGDGLHFDGWLAPTRRGADDTVTGATMFAFDISEHVAERTAQLEQMILIAEQHATIRQLATPILQLAEGVLCLPIIGAVDADRANQMMATLLEAVVREHARFTIIDLTGVESLDESSARRLVELTTAARMLGTESLFSGIPSAVAHRLVALGADLSSVRSVRSLEAALRHCATGATGTRLPRRS